MQLFSTTGYRKRNYDSKGSSHVVVAAAASVVIDRVVGLRRMTRKV